MLRPLGGSRVPVWFKATGLWLLVVLAVLLGVAILLLLMLSDVMQNMGVD